MPAHPSILAVELVKSASALRSILSSPELRSALIGAGLGGVAGAGVGALADGKKGALLGAGVGAGVGAVGGGINGSDEELIAGLRGNQQTSLQGILKLNQLLQSIPSN